MILNKNGVIESPFEPVKNRRKYWQRKGTNIIPTDASCWESGYYSNVDGTKQPYDFGGRVRLKNLIEVIPNTEYIVSTNSTSALIIVRSYDKNQNFIQSIGGISDGNILTTSENEKYISITINDDSTINTQAILTKIENGTIKPFISVEPAMFELNKNGQYEKIKKAVNIITGVEFETGRIIDGKKEYGKRIDCGTLPNNTSLVVNTGLSNVTFTRKPEGFAQLTAGGSNTMPLPYLDPRDATASISLSLISEYRIAIVTCQDRSSLNGFVDVFYVKD